MSEVLFCMCFLREISVSCLDLLARHPVRRVFPNAVWSGHCRLLVGEVSPYFHGGPRDPRPAAVPRLRAAALVCAPHPVRGEGEGGARAGGESYHRLTAPTPPCCCAPHPRRVKPTTPPAVGCHRRKRRLGSTFEGKITSRIFGVPPKRKRKNSFQWKLTLRPFVEKYFSAARLCVNVSMTLFLLFY
ncbi:uncharacterized protein LOC124775952 [Schistocerca piceifrons]|uniref:uncharacterized protein LOC124775952 n=1 Tax=Schistocerca piceifrons TaxID=274613 RepID=UPI001F5E5E21|nr:uncharacterized protein LOC124775952 [Schistocerca piceifrons]